MKKILIFVFLSTLFSCERSKRSAKEIVSETNVPTWSRNVIWYQIFPERFRNGDQSNDPRPEDMQRTFPETIPTSWMTSDWGADWYEEDAWMKDLPDLDFNGKLQLRRYGGDLQGVLDKLDYLEELGITGIYFNPLNDAPSLHKYDPRNWRHIDRNFGPNPDGDVRIMESENPIDPSTWQWTEADQMFLKLIDELHDRNIKVIMDFSWNHTGYDFWAVNDIRKNSRNSKYSDWYDVEQFDDPTTDEDETKISGWWGFKYLPLINEKVENEDARLPHEGNVVSEDFKQHVFHVSQRWLDPNGDGNFEDGVDGFRMDVASEMTLGWWRDYSAFVKSVNPEALLIGEVWWFDWPDLTGPEKMITEGDFDGLMNYRWFALSSGLFKQNGPKLKPTEFVTWYDSLITNIDVENQQAMMNIVATHDTPRLSTSLFNESRFDQGSKISENPAYKVHRPDEATWKLLKMYLLHQFSFIGSPHIWNGDELGMWGANDPDERKPIWWDDIEFADEAAHPYRERVEPPDKVESNQELLKYYKQLIQIRKENPVLAYGDLDYVLQYDQRLLFGYSRKWDGKEAIALFNISDDAQSVSVSSEAKSYVDALTGEVVLKKDDNFKVVLKGKEGKVFLSK